MANTSIYTAFERMWQHTIAKLGNYLSKTNEAEYIPVDDYNPATKKYVDESIEAIPAPVFVVNVTGDDENGYSADKTFEEIDEAYNNDKYVICKYVNAIFICICQATAGESALYVFTSTITNNVGVTEKSFFIFDTNNISLGKGTFTQDQITTVNTNSSLTTTDKTIVGAINEINSSLTSSVSSHNTSTESHSDIRILISTLTTNLTNLTTRLNALADSDDETLDQMSEVVALIKNNASLIEGITTSKVNVKDIIDNLTTDSSDKPLSAAQGVVLKALIDAIIIPTLLSQLSEDSTHRLVTDDEKELWNNKSDFSGNYNDLTNIPTFSIEKHTDGLIYIFINGVPTGTGLDINTISDTTEE